MKCGVRVSTSSVVALRDERQHFYHEIQIGIHETLAKYNISQGETICIFSDDEARWRKALVPGAVVEITTFTGVILKGHVIKFDEYLLTMDALGKSKNCPTNHEILRLMITFLKIVLPKNPDGTFVFVQPVDGGCPQPSCRWSTDIRKPRITSLLDLIALHRGPLFTDEVVLGYHEAGMITDEVLLSVRSLSGQSSNPGSSYGSSGVGSLGCDGKVTEKRKVDDGVATAEAGDGI